MLPFDYYNPTRVVFGKNRIAELSRLIPAQSRVMVLYGGGSVKRFGTLVEVRQALEPRHVVEFGGIEPNPSYETLMQAVELVRSQRIDFLLAVGGGSVIDGTKFVAAAALYEHTDTWSMMEGFGRHIQQALPLGVVLTLPATGSEMNDGAVITNKALTAKLTFLNEKVFPQFAILDPTKSYTLPERQIANGVVDAYIHILEQYLTYPVDAMVQDRFAESLLKILLEIGPNALQEPENYTLRANLMWVATLALNGLIGAGVPHDWATHAMGHEMTALYEIDHARTLAIVLPAMLQIRQEEKHAKLLQYAERVWDLREGDAQSRIEQAIFLTRSFFEQMGLPTRLRDYGLGAEAIDQIVNQLCRHGMVQLGERGTVTPNLSRAVLNAAV